jgi:hypothetical protein
VHAGAKDRQAPFAAEGIVEARRDLAGGVERGDRFAGQLLEEIV